MLRHLVEVEVEERRCLVEEQARSKVVVVVAQHCNHIRKERVVDSRSRPELVEVVELVDPMELRLEQAVRSHLTVAGSLGCCCHTRNSHSHERCCSPARGQEQMGRLEKPMVDELPMVLHLGLGLGPDRDAPTVWVRRRHWVQLQVDQP